VDNGTRTTQQASRGGTPWGLKPADKSSATANHRAVDRPVLCPMLTRGTCVWGVVTSNRWKWLTHLTQTGRWGQCRAINRALVVPDPPGVEQAATGHYRLSCWNWGTPILLDPARGAKMPARGREGGGSVVAECSAVMAETGWRSARKATDLSRPLHTKTPASWGVRKEFTRNVERGLWGRTWITGASTESRMPGNWPVRFGAGERPWGPTYCYQS